jgi:ferrous iron transport protein A
VKLNELPIGTPALVDRVDGERSYRRRLLELGILPGSPIRVLRIAPLGDPLEISSQGSNLSIRAQEASAISVRVVQGTSLTSTLAGVRN